MILKWRTAGQACTHANRVYVRNEVYEYFGQMMLEATQELRVGHSAQSQVQRWDLSRSGLELRSSRVMCLTLSVNESKFSAVVNGRRASVATSSSQLLSDMTSDMLTTKGEIFGPLLELCKFKTEEEVVRLANDTSMGLPSYFFTKDVSRAWRLQESL